MRFVSIVANDIYIINVKKKYYQLLKAIISYKG